VEQEALVHRRQAVQHVGPRPVVGRVGLEAEALDHQRAVQRAPAGEHVVHVGVHLVNVVLGDQALDDEEALLPEGAVLLHADPVFVVGFEGGRICGCHDNFSFVLVWAPACLAALLLEARLGRQCKVNAR
jgi:hypothetical protein